MVYLAYLFIISLLVGIDQYTKKLIVTLVKEHSSIQIVPNFFSITYEKNTGAGFSILQNQRVLFIVITIIAIIGFSYLLIKNKNQKNIYKISYILIISGAIGNFIDRIVNSYVVDFLDFIIFGYDFPVFNFADCLLTIGVFIYIIATILETKNAKN